MSVSVIRGIGPDEQLHTIKVTADGLLLTESSTSSGMGGATESTLQLVLERLAPQPLKPSIEIIDIDIPDKEFSAEFVDVKLLEIYCRSNVQMRYSFEPGVVESRREYRTLPVGASQPISLPQGYSWSGTLYLAASADASKPDAFPIIIEVETWQ